VEASTDVGKYHDKTAELLGKQSHISCS
jgi:hypothetical protein